MRNLYTIGICATLLVVALAPEIRTVEEFLQRGFFLLFTVFIGYLVLRHQFRLRYATRLKKAFSTNKHRDLRTEAMYRLERKQLLTA